MQNIVSQAGGGGAARERATGKRVAAPGGDEQRRARPKVADYVSDDAGMRMLDELLSTNGVSSSSTQHVASVDGSQATATGDGDESESDDAEPRDKYWRKFAERQNNRRASSQDPRADSLPASNDDNSNDVVVPAASAPLRSASVSDPGSKPLVSLQERMAMLRRRCFGAEGNHRFDGRKRVQIRWGCWGRTKQNVDGRGVTRF